MRNSSGDTILEVTAKAAFVIMDMISAINGGVITLFFILTAGE